MAKILTLTILSITLLLGCHSHSCLPNSITPVFIGFSASDIDTLILRKYKPNDNFLHLVDTAIITNPKYAYRSSNDTTVVYVNTISGYNYITADFDWKIYIPSKNRTVLLSDIVSKETETSCWKCSCISPITSFMEDGQFMIPQVDSSRIFGYPIGYVAYIHN
jgi:hypothetical protein